MSFRLRHLEQLHEVLTDLIEYDSRRLAMCPVCHSFNSDDIAGHLAMNDMVRFQHDLVRIIEEERSSL